MRLLLAGLGMAVTLSSPLLAQEALEILDNKGPKPGTDSVSLIIGHQMGTQLAQNGLTPEDINKDDLLQGIVLALEGKEMGLSQEEVKAALTTFSQKMKTRFDAKSKVKLEEANKFLEDNKKKDGVQVTESGLQYKVIKAGEGATPTAENQVTVHYEGKLTNGQIFDSSRKRGEPASFPVNGVIPGWTEALQRMKVGDVWMLFIPPNLAYGERGSPGGIGPNEALIFEVELLEVVGK